MMKNQTTLPKSRLIFASPWILAAAIGILTAIVLLFAVNNMQREKRIMTEGLLNKGQAIIRFIGAGTRASMMMGTPNSIQVQHLIEQAAGESSIQYIAVVDRNGRILAHSHPKKIGGNFDHPLPDLDGLKPMGNYRILERHAAPHKIFEVVSVFRPFPRGRGRFFRRHMEQMHRSQTPPPDNQPSPKNWCEPLMSPKAWGENGNRFIVVGLDMAEYEKIIRQGLYHIISISFALLLLGIGGWVALLAVQGYKSSQNTLEYVQAFTALLISKLPVGIIATDGQDRIQTVNASAREMTGISPTKARRKKPVDVLPPMLAELFTGLGQDEELLDREIDFSPDEHKNLAIHASSVPVSDSEGNFIGRVLLLYDLTRLKNLEKEMQKHEHLVSLGKMAAGVAHEVRNPLSSIKGLATLLGSRFTKQSKEQEAAGLLVNEVERLNRSITELLNYARPLPLKRVDIDLETAISNSLKLVEGDAAELGIELSHRVESEMPPLKADADRLNQVLLNLYLNSIQAMEKGGKLHVHARPGKKSGTIEIVVRDTGIGMEDEVIGRVMDPYFTTKADGTGLGLAMVHKIVDEHQGGIDIASTPGEGTTVTLNFPAGK